MCILWFNSAERLVSSLFSKARSIAWLILASILAGSFKFCFCSINLLNICPLLWNRTRHIRDTKSIRRSTCCSKAFYWSFIPSLTLILKYCWKELWFILWSMSIFYISSNLSLTVCCTFDSSMINYRFLVLRVSHSRSNRKIFSVRVSYALKSCSYRSCKTCSVFFISIYLILCLSSIFFAFATFSTMRIS